MCCKTRNFVSSILAQVLVRRWMTGRDSPAVNETQELKFPRRQQIRAASMKNSIISTRSVTFWQLTISDATMWDKRLDQEIYWLTLESWHCPKNILFFGKNVNLLDLRIFYLTSKFPSRSGIPGYKIPGNLGNMTSGDYFYIPGTKVPNIRESKSPDWKIPIHGIKISITQNFKKHVVGLIQK